MESLDAFLVSIFVYIFAHLTSNFKPQLSMKMYPYQTLFPAGHFETYNIYFIIFMLNCCLNDLNYGCCQESHPFRNKTIFSNSQSSSQFQNSESSNFGTQSKKISIALLRKIKKHGS